MKYIIVLHQRMKVRRDPIKILAQIKRNRMKNPTPNLVESRKGQERILAQIPFMIIRNMVFNLVLRGINQGRIKRWIIIVKN